MKKISIPPKFILNCLIPEIIISLISVFGTVSGQIDPGIMLLRGTGERASHMPNIHHQWTGPLYIEIRAMLPGGLKMHTFRSGIAAGSLPGYFLSGTRNGQIIIITFRIRDS
jgi:hypothetical protein